MNKLILALLTALITCAGLSAQSTIDVNNVRAKDQFSLGSGAGRATVTSIVTVIDGSSTHSQLGSALAMYNAIQSKAVARDTTLKGNGTSGNPLGINQMGATNGQVLKYNTSLGRWAPAADDGANLSGGTGITITGTPPNITITNTGDLSSTNEVQNLGLTGQALSISLGGTGVTLPVIGVAAGTGIGVAGAAGVWTITNTGDTDPSNDLTTSTTFGGDVSGLYNTLTVTHLRNTPVSATAPTTGQFLRYNGSAWLPAVLVSGDLPVILPSGVSGFDEAAQDAALGIVSATGGITATYNDGAGTFVIGSSTLGGDLSGNLPNPTVARIRSVNVSATTPTTGQVLKYDGTNWAPGTDNNSGGISTLNTLTTATQTFATGTAGTDFNISSAASTHTFNLPTASASNRGALSSTDWTTFNNSVDGSGASGRVAFWSGSSALSSNSNYVFDNTNTRLGIGTTTPFVRNQTTGGDIGAYYSSGSSHGASLYLGDPNFDNSSFFDKAPGLKALYSGSTGVASDLGFFIYGGGSRLQGMVLNSLGLAIGTSSASERLHVAGNIRFSGALMPNNNAGTAGQRLTSAGPGAPPTWEPLPASPFYQYSLTVPTTASNAVGFAQVTNTNFSANVEIWYTVNSDNFAQSKRYFLPTAYNGTYNGSTHEWQKCLPISTSGPYSGNDAEIDVLIVNGDAFFRVRRTSGSTPGTAKITLLIGGDVPGTTVSAFSTSYTSQTVANNYQPTSLVQRNGNTGVGTDSPTAQLDLVGTLRLRAFAVANNLLGLSDASGNVTSFSPATVVANGNGFIQNGNAFGALARLGTNDAQGLSFETNNTVRETISATGGITYTMPAAELVTLDYSATSAGTTNYGVVVRNQLGSSGQGQFLTTQNQGGTPVFYATNRTLSTIFYNTSGRLTQFKQVGAEFQINVDESVWAFRPDLSVSFPSLAGDPTTPANNTLWLTGGRYKHRTGGANKTLANVEDDLTGASTTLTGGTYTVSGITRTITANAQSASITITIGLGLDEGRDYYIVTRNNGTNTVTINADTASGVFVQQAGNASQTTSVAVTANSHFSLRRTGSVINVK